MAPYATVQTPYRWIRPKIGNGYLLLLKRPGIIPWGTGGKASHAMMAVWRECEYGKTLCVVEAREKKGIRCVTLSSQVRDFPGMIDVYKPYGCPKEVMEYAAYVAINQTGKQYAYWGLTRVAIERLLLARWLCGLFGYDVTATEPTKWADDKFCSMGFSWFYERAILEQKYATDWKPVYNLPVNRVVPAQLEHSGSFRCIARNLVHRSERLAS